MMRLSRHMMVLMKVGFAVACLALVVLRPQWRDGLRAMEYDCSTVQLCPDTCSWTASCSEECNLSCTVDNGTEVTKIGTCGDIGVCEGYSCDALSFCENTCSPLSACSDTCIISCRQEGSEQVVVEGTCGIFGVCDLCEGLGGECDNFSCDESTCGQSCTDSCTGSTVTCEPCPGPDPEPPQDPPEDQDALDADEYSDDEDALCEAEAPDDVDEPVLCAGAAKALLEPDNPIDSAGYSDTEAPVYEAATTQAAQCGPQNRPPKWNPQQRRKGGYPEVDTPLPKNAGYISYQPPDQQWGQQITVTALEVLGARWWTRHYLASDHCWDAPRIQIGDLSYQGGGDHPQHASHHLGFDVDIRILRNDKEGSCEVTNPKCYSRERTQEMIDMLEEMHDSSDGICLERIFSADKSLNGPHVKPDKVHYDHIHVRFRPCP